MSTTYVGEDGKTRCGWCAATPEYRHYHDTEWGYPVADDIRLFEKICLEGFQAGLSWRTILAKRENFRRAFQGFDFNEIATFTQKDVECLLLDKGIVRHRGKIEAVINNAKRAQALVNEVGSLAVYFWRYEPKENEVYNPLTRATSPESIVMSKDLKKRGWKFVGPTTAYAFMQAMGLVNDHVKACEYYEQVNLARKAFTPPC